MPRQQRSPAKRARSRIARKDTVHPFDEKVVGETDRTVPVAPVKQSRKAREPMPEPALDRRTKIIDSGESKARPRR